MHRKLLEVLADPVTGEPLRLDGDCGEDEIWEAVLIAPSGAQYLIERGIPRFVPSESYSASFGLQWNRFATVQLDSVTGASYSRDRFDAEVPWGAEIQDAWVVDAGCGSGRFAEVAADYGAEVIAVDLSGAVEAVQSNFSRRPNIHVIQADLRQLPIRRDAITFLYSIGVLQHTPNPLEATRALINCLPSGGRFAFTIYGRRPWTRLYGKYWWRPITTRVPAARLLAAIERAMPVLFPTTSLLFAIPVVGKLFRFVVPVANYVERRAVLPRWIRYREAILDTFDMLAPEYDQPVRRQEVEAALTPLAKDIVFESALPVVVNGTKR